MAIYTVEDLRSHYGVNGQGKTDEQLIQDYAPRLGMDPKVLADKLGYVPPSVQSQSPPITAAYQEAQQRGGLTADRMTEKAIGGAVLGLSVSLLLSAIAFVRWGLPRLRGAIGKSAGAGVGAVAAGVDKARLAGVHPNSRGYDAFYVQAIDEIDESRADKATWARALASSDGDDGRCRANYIKLRVSQLALIEREGNPREHVGAVQQAGESSQGASDRGSTKSPREVAVSPQASPRTTPPPNTDGFTADQCASSLQAAGCRVASQGQEMWEVLQPSGVIAFAYSLDAFQKLAARYGA